MGAVISFLSVAFSLSLQCLGIVAIILFIRVCIKYLKTK